MITKYTFRNGQELEIETKHSITEEIKKTGLPKAITITKQNTRTTIITENLNTIEEED